MSDSPASQDTSITVIEPNRSWLSIPWRELVRYRDLLFLMVRRDFVATYVQTVLGPAWYVIQPLAMTIVFTIVFGKVAKISTDGLPKLPFYLCGTMAWGYFGKCLQGTSRTFVGNAGVFGKVYFPRLIVPISVVLTSLFSFAIQFLTFLCFWLYYKFGTEAGSDLQMRAGAFLLPLLVLQSGVLGLGVGLWMSSLTAKYRDFQYVMGLLTRMWLYATPVVYPLSLVPEHWRWVAGLNPMTAVVESYRALLLGVGTLDPLYTLQSVATTFLVVLTGIFVFNRTERTFIDTV